MVLQHPMKRKNPFHSADFSSLHVLCCLLVFSSTSPLHASAKDITASAQDPSSVRPQHFLAVNQVGYFPESPKIAFLVTPRAITNVDTSPLCETEAPRESDTHDSCFSENVRVVEQESGKTIQSIALGNPRNDLTSGDTVREINFSHVTSSGTYYLTFHHLRSYPFQIEKEVYDSALKTLLRSFYLQRCGVVIRDESTHIFHPACHMEDGVIAHDDAIHEKDEIWLAPGGWHDAGDYGKYVATTTIVIGRLLHLYENIPTLFRDGDLNIPESSNEIPDILDEVRVGVEWLLHMQREDGAFYRKIAGDDWPSLVPPHEDIQPRMVYGASTPETAKAIGALALAARIYQVFDEPFFQLCLEASERAWDYLQSHPTMTVEWEPGDDSGSGKYLASDIDREITLRRDRDDRLWAAAELWATTGKAKYHAYFASQAPSLPYTIFEWKNPAPLGFVKYLEQRDLPRQATLTEQIMTKVVTRAEKALKYIKTSGYHIANHRLIWGSNKMTLEQGMNLYHAHQLTKNQDFLVGAAEQLDYIFGRNPFNQSFVTGIGSKSVQHTSHIFARAEHIQIPGLLVGGPNESAQAGIAPKQEGLLSYVDDARSYATNEYAIDYNASLIALIGFITNEYTQTPPYESFPEFYPSFHNLPQIQ